VHDKKQPKVGDVIGMERIHLISVLTDPTYAKSALNSLVTETLPEPENEFFVVTRACPLTGVFKAGGRLYFATAEIVDPEHRRKKHQPQAT
jgi:hypothetical protein